MKILTLQKCKFFYHPRNKLLRGIGYLEMIIVISIIVIISGFSYPFLSRYMLSNNLSLSEDKLMSAVRKAQINSISGKDGVKWGVCLKDENIRLYSVSCEAPTFYYDYSLLGSVNTVGPFDVLFNKRGEPSSAQSITLKTRIDQTVVSVNALGGINVE